ncbi:MAG: amidohydrolase family protein [Sphingobium sp.]
MDQLHDLIIRGGFIVDGTGRSREVGDVAIKDGRITAVGQVTGRGREEIDATGKLVTPGFVDIHTHYDGQVTWESTLAPSSNHGVTTVVMGNCGVGFAPCRPSDRQRLVQLMEGVEDIPEIVMTEGLPWNWETFEQYLDALDTRRLDVDIAAQVPHSALRVYVMGQRGSDREDATSNDCAQMTALVADAVRAGAWGVSTSRQINHRSADGEPIPSLGSPVRELKALANGLKEAGAGVFQIVPNFFNDATVEFGVMREIAEECGRPLSFSLIQLNNELWRDYLSGLAKARKDGLTIRGQIFPRPVGTLVGLDLSYNPLCRRPSWARIADLPLAEKVAALREPAFRTEILAETDSPHIQPTVNVVLDRLGEMIALDDVPNYMPQPADTLAYKAKVAGKDLIEYALDAMLENEGRRVLYLAAGNYANFSSAVLESFLTNANCIVGLGDGGAHYGLVCDASYPTTLLTKWVRSDGALTFEEGIRKLTSEPADFIGFTDRGRIAPGLLADLNIIDLDRMTLYSPQIVHDLPSGGRRLRQKADGYDVTIKSGVVTYRAGVPTGALPGQLVRNNAATH